MRRLAILVALACANAQIVFGSSLVASALTLGIYARHAHGHSVELQLDGDHLDVVLSHGEGDADHHGAGTSVSQGDHVVHVTAADVASATGRRAVVEGGPVLAATFTLAPVVVPPVWSPSRSLAPRACGTAHLRTVVLRL